MRGGGPVQAVTVFSMSELDVAPRAALVCSACVEGAARGAAREVFRVSLADADLPLGARFAPFSAVQGFVSALIDVRPGLVLVERLSGLSGELARFALALGFAVALRLPEASRLPVPADRAGWRWLGGLLARSTFLLAADSPADEALVRSVLADLPAVSARADLHPVPPAPGEARNAFGYEAYAFGQRDHGLLYEMQEMFGAHFAGCESVLDIGCGTGVFLEVLARMDIPARGVERNPMSARYAASLGHDVMVDDALAFLGAATARWDGVYCSHFIEHLPFELADRLVSDVARALRPGGVAVFVFPDPESIRSQLLGFWRDPEHVRFYHPGLVVAMAQVHGLVLEFDSQQASGRRIVPFSMAPPLAVRPVEVEGWRERLFARLGLATAAALRRERERADQLEAAIRQLWAVNQTWAWDDNAVLRFRKPPGA